MKSTTIFTFGYWGWGNATKELVKVIDQVEKSRGYKPPLFIDIRIRRSVRAKGFNGNAFENLVGQNRYKWMDGLGNLAIIKGGSMRLKDIKQCTELLNIVESEAKQKRRVVLFCACEYPGPCHRLMVADQTIAEANRRRKAITIVEWPGFENEKNMIRLNISESNYNKIQRDNHWIAIDKGLSLTSAGAIPWYTPLELKCNSESITVLSGPCRYRDSEWHLPILYRIESHTEKRRIKGIIKDLRRKYGYLSRAR